MVSGCTVSAAAWMAKRPDRLGVLMTPRNGNRIAVAVKNATVWAGDNDCFQGLHAPRFLRFVAKVLESGHKPAWVACPDVVGDSTTTLRQFDVWEPMLHSLGLPVALVGQDGLEPTAVPWDRLDAFFIGGSTEWKLGDPAATLAREAHDRGKLVHVGRVNSLRRIVYFARRMRDGQAWCDTIDGSGFSAWGDKRIHLAVRWIDKALADRQTVMFGGQA